MASSIDDEVTPSTNMRFPTIAKPLPDEQLGTSGIHQKGLFFESRSRPGQKYRAIMDGLVAQMDALDAAVTQVALSLPEMPADAKRRLSESVDGTPQLEDVQDALAQAAQLSGFSRSASPAGAVRTAPRDLGGPQWGATEGGRDKLGWVRQLVRYTETHPILVPPPDGQVTGDVDTIDSAASGGGIHTTVFPSLNPARREDVVLLQAWLKDTMAQLTAEVGDKGATTVQGAVDMADGALWLYQLAFEEVRRQVAGECRERGELLAACWEHCNALTQLRASLVYEPALSSVQTEAASLSSASTVAAAQQRASEWRLQLAAAAVLELRSNVLSLQHDMEDAQQDLHRSADRITALQADLTAESLGHAGAVGTVCALRGLVAFWQGQCRRLEVQLHTSAAAEASAKRMAAADMAAVSTEAADNKERLQIAQQVERELQQKLALLEAEVTQSTRGLQTASSRIASLEERLASAMAESAAARDANAAAAVEAARRLSIEAAEGTAAHLLRGEVEELRGVNHQLQRLQASDRAAAAAREELLQQRVSLAEDAAAHASTKAAALREEASLLGAANGRLHADCETLRGRLGAAEPALAACQAQVQAFQNGLEQCALMVAQTRAGSRRRDSAVASESGQADSMAAGESVNESSAYTVLRAGPELSVAMSSQRELQLGRLQDAAPVAPAAWPAVARRISTTTKEPGSTMAAIQAHIQASASAVEAAERRERITQQRLTAEGQLRISLSSELLKVKSEKGALARQRSELQAQADRQQGQLTEARARQAASTAALAQLDQQMAQKTTQLAEAQAAIARLQEDGRAADTAMRSMMLQSSQQQEQIVNQQQAVLRSQQQTAQEAQKAAEAEAASAELLQQLQEAAMAAADAGQRADETAARDAEAQGVLLQQLQEAFEQQRCSKEEAAALHEHAAVLHARIEDLTSENDHLATRAAAGDAAVNRLQVAHFLLDDLTAGPDRLQAQHLREAATGLRAELQEALLGGAAATAARDILVEQLQAAATAMADQAEELVAARAEAQQLGNMQAALQGAFVQLQTEVDCLRMRPIVSHPVETRVQPNHRPDSAESFAAAVAAPPTPLLSRRTAAHTDDSLVMDIKRPVMHIRQTVDKRATGSTRASRMGGYMSTADTDAGWPLHPHISQILALQAEADTVRQELEMAHMASATAAANFQEHSADLRAKLEAAERQLSLLQHEFALLQAAADAAAAEHVVREAQYAAQLAVAAARAADLQEQLAQSEQRRTALEEMARQGLNAVRLSDDGQSAQARRWHSLQRETMWLRAKICVLAQFCKVLRCRLAAAEQRCGDALVAAG